MTMSDLSDADLSDADQPSDGFILLKRALLGIGGGFALLFIAGIIAGYTSAVVKHGGPSLIDVAMLTGMVVAAGALGYGIWRIWPQSSGEPEAPRVKSARKILIAVVIISFPLGILLALADDTPSVFSNGPINPAIALIALAIWLIPAPILTWLWWRRVDEHEANAYRDGALIAMHTYMFLAPAWWMGTRAGFLPPQDPMAVLLLVSAVWGAAWFARRYF